MATVEVPVNFIQNHQRALELVERLQAEIASTRVKKRFRKAKVKAILRAQLYKRYDLEQQQNQLI